MQNCHEILIPEHTRLRGDFATVLTAEFATETSLKEMDFF